MTFIRVTESNSSLTSSWHLIDNYLILVEWVNDCNDRILLRIIHRYKKLERSIQGYILSRLSFFEQSVPVSVVAFFLHIQEPLRNSNTYKVIWDWHVTLCQNKNCTQMKTTGMWIIPLRNRGIYLIPHRGWRMSIHIFMKRIQTLTILHYFAYALAWS